MKMWLIYDTHLEILLYEYISIESFIVCHTKDANNFTSDFELILYKRRLYIAQNH